MSLLLFDGSRRSCRKRSERFSRLSLQNNNFFYNICYVEHENVSIENLFRFYKLFLHRNRLFVNLFIVLIIL